VRLRRRKMPPSDKETVALLIVVVLGLVLLVSGLGTVSAHTFFAITIFVAAAYFVIIEVVGRFL